jgi:hypothetical protein
MVSPIQTVQSAQASGGTSIPCTITASQGGPLIILCPVGMGGSSVTWAVTDNKSNIYTKRADSVQNSFTEAMIWDCLSPGTGVTTVTLTPTGETANGTITVVEMPSDYYGCRDAIWKYYWFRSRRRAQTNFSS